MSKNTMKLLPKISDRRFVAFIHFTPENISLGVTIDYLSPNIEIHLPFCFLKLGWTGVIEKESDSFLGRRTFGVYPK